VSARVAEGPRRLRLISVAQFDKEYLKSGFQMLLLLLLKAISSKQQQVNLVKTGSRN
jgi:hypothetical protein